MKTATAGSETKLGKKGLMDVAKMDELKQLGWRVENLESGFSAYEINGDRRIGPFTSVAQLVEAVKAEVGDKIDLPLEDTASSDESEPAEVELTENSSGQQYIPGAGPIVNKELFNFASEHFRIKNERMELSRLEKEAKDNLEFAAQKHIHLFKTDPDTGLMTYRAGDVVIELEKTEGVKLKTRSATEDDD